MTPLSREDLVLALLRAFSDGSLNTEGRIRHLLELGRSYFNVEYAIVSRIRQERYFVRYVSSSDPAAQNLDELPTRDTVCQFVLQSGSVEAFTHLSESQVGPTLTPSPFEFESYIGAPIYADQQLVGTICFEGLEPKTEQFDPRDADLVTMLADWIGEQIKCDRMHEDLDAILSASPIYVMHKDHDNRILQVNPSFASICAKPADTLVGQFLPDVLPASSVDVLSASDDWMWQTGHSIQGETMELVTAEGNMICLHGSRLPYFDPVSRDPRMMLVAVDISEQIRREEELRTLNEVLTRQKRAITDLYHRTPAMLHSINSKGKVLDVSEHWLSKLGYKREDVVGRSVLDFMTPASRQYAKTISLPGFWKRGYSNDIQYQFQTSWGDVVEIELSAVADRQFDDEESRSLAVLVDVTERNAAIRALEDANEDLKQFSSIASHDIQEPLRKIRSFAEVLSDAVSDQNEDEIHYALNVMSSSAERASQLVTDLLAFSRVSHRDLNITFQPLHQIIQTALDNLSMQIEEASAQITLDIAGLEVSADGSLAPQIFQNLLSNAIKYRSHDRPVEISISAEPSPAGLRITIRDNGEGFDPKHAAQIFEPFKRLTTASDRAGTGIGLAIVSKIAYRHGWVIEASSKPGEGSCFTITMPENTGNLPGTT
ncbi:GAF domain-containing sensor histidine kinase [Coralliovum pocilloporae]|uniref:GAF domain-containing sensor histidine kinase n=1 Tax=Coralliovum pocilloporae TaxID=3066369 RepID=UPI003307A61E